MYDKFVTGVAWPGLFIFALLVVPFVDRYKKFSWKDRPMITAVGITSIAQIMVTTYWGFYIDPDIKKALLERLVIDPIFFYLIMLLLVPLSFGFTYMMIKLAKNAEANTKLQPKKPSGKKSINLTQRWTYIIFVALLAFQIYLNISAYYAVLNGMKNFSLFIIGIIMLVFAGMFHIYRHARTMERAPPPQPPSRPPTPPMAAKPAPPLAVEKPLAPPQPVQKQKAIETQYAGQASQSKPSSSMSEDKTSPSGTKGMSIDNIPSATPGTEEMHDKDTNIRHQTKKV
jgi:ubiquinol-cytochrome c reductase cytochrome b subunit